MMTGLADFGNVERDAFRKFYEDGLFDLFLGLMMGILALGHVVADWSGSEILAYLVFGCLALVLVAILKMTRLRLLRSRLGDFKPGPARRRRITIFRLALLTSVLLGLVAFIVTAAVYKNGVSVASLEVWVPIAWFINATVIFGIMAYTLDVPRFYLWGVLFGSAGPLLIWPDALWDLPVPSAGGFVAAAAVIASTGVYKLTHFLRDHPAQPPAEIAALHGGH